MPMLTLSSVEVILAALFARAKAVTWAALPVSGATGFVSAERRLRFIEDVPLGNMPALYQLQDEFVTRRKTQQPNLLLRASWYVYVATLTGQDATVVPSTQLNIIFDALRAAMEPTAADGASQRNTLGGLVYDARLSEDRPIKNFEGILDDRGVLVIPVEITVPF